MHLYDAIPCYFLSGKGTNTCWTMFMKYAHLLTGVVRDDNVDGALAFVCSFYGIGEKDVRGIDDARHSIFVKTKRDLDVFPPTRGTLELHITRANYQAKIWLYADHVIMDLENEPPETIDLSQEGKDPVVCMQPFRCLCKYERQQGSGIDTIKYHTCPRKNKCKSNKITINTTNKSQEVSPFPSGDHKAEMNRRESMTNTRHK